MFLWSQTTGVIMLLSFPREIGLRRRPCSSRAVYDTYIDNINGKASCYTSLYSFERMRPGKHWKVDVNSVIMDRAWWDFDSSDQYPIDVVKHDVYCLLSRLKGDVRIVATGRGFHVHELFSKPVRGVAISKHIDRYQRKIARGLKTLDGVGNPQKLTRIPDTYNPKRKRWSVNIDPKQFQNEPLKYDIPKFPSKELSKFDPFIGMENRSTFDIIKWISDNPAPKSFIAHNVEDVSIGSALDVPLPTCLDKAIHVENPRHEIRVALAQFLSQNLRWFVSKDAMSSDQMNLIADQICSYISTLNWRDYNPQTTHRNVHYIINSYDNSPSPKWYLSRGYCDGNCWFCEGGL